MMPHLQVQQLRHPRRIVDRVGDHRVTRRLNGSDVMNFARRGLQTRTRGRRLATVDKGVRITVIEHHMPGRADGRFFVAVQTRMMPRRVQNPHRGRFFIERILRRTDFLAGVVKVRQTEGHFEELARRVGVEEEGAELVPEPEGAIGSALHRFEVEIRAGENAHDVNCSVIVNGTFLSGSRSSKKPSTSIVPEPPCFILNADGCDRRGDGNRRNFPERRSRYQA